MAHTQTQEQVSEHPTERSDEEVTQDFPVTAKDTGKKTTDRVLDNIDSITKEVDDLAARIAEEGQWEMFLKTSAFVGEAAVGVN